MPYYQTKTYRSAAGASATDSYISEYVAGKHLGRMQFRAYQYLHVKTNIYCDSFMVFFTATGYMYNNGNIHSTIGCYPYAGNLILNIHVNNTGNTIIDTAYPSSDNYCCLRFNRGSSGYTEGVFDLILSGHNKADYESFVITNWTLTNSASNQY